MITSNLQMRKLRLTNINRLPLATQLIGGTEISSQVLLTSKLMYAPSTSYHVLLKHHLLRLHYIHCIILQRFCCKKKVIGEKKEYSLQVYLCIKCQVSPAYVASS